jgi:peroxiredoxin
MTTETSAKAQARPWLKVLIAAAVVVIGVVGYLSLSSRSVAPDVTFTSLKGDKIAMQQLRGKVVMVNFWATSCSTCIKEMPSMVQTYNQYKDKGLDFIAVAMSYDPPNYVVNYAETRQLPFKVALDVQGEIAQSFGDVKLTPTTYLIDKQGRIIKRYVGEPSFEEVHRLVEQALAA